MHEQIVATLAALTFGILLGIWVYSLTLRFMLIKYTISLEDDRFLFTPHAPTTEQETQQCQSLTSDNTSPT